MKYWVDSQRVGGPRLSESELTRRVYNVLLADASAQRAEQARTDSALTRRIYNVLLSNAISQRAGHAQCDLYNVMHKSQPEKGALP